MAARRKKLTKAEVESLIRELTSEATINRDMLLAFAEKVNGGSFIEAKAKPEKAKGMTMTAAKKAVLSKFGCKNVTELRKNNQ